MSDIPAALRTKLDANEALMSELGAAATPAIYYLDADGRLQQHKGAPRPDALRQIMEER